MTMCNGMMEEGKVKEDEKELLRKCVVVIDGTEIKITRTTKSDDYQRSHYSGKKKCHSLSAQVVVNIVSLESVCWQQMF